MEWLTAIRGAVSYAEDHLTDDVSLDDVARAVHLSPFFLQRGFSLLTGWGVGEYLRNRRLYEAALDLQKGSEKVIDIALRYGYETPESFTKTPKEHDFATAAISHLPHVISATLVNLVKANDSDKEILRTIAAGGFKDITRISSSSPVMWQHICQANREEILHLIDLYMESFSDFRSAIEAEDTTKIHSLFQNAKNYRDSMRTQSTGILPQSFEFYCDLMDEAGGIATIATILAAHALNIKNIGIIHDREFEEGVLHIEMYDNDSMEKAITLLQQHRYTVHKKK